jgi:amino acid adenylation domain-containing protein
MSETSKPVADCFPHESIQVPLTGLTKPFAELENKVQHSIAHRFEQQAAKYPNRIAVKTTREELTYGDLNKAANHVARAIVAEHGTDQEPVAILMEAGASAIAAILGVLKSQKFYVLLKPSHPRTRNEYIFQDLQAGLIVTDHETLSLAQQLALDNCRLLNIDELGSTFSTDNLARSCSPDNLACVIYTSGSVGQPKGIVHSHRTALHFRTKGATRLDIGEKDRVTSVGLDIFTPIMSGAASFPWNITKDGLADLAEWLMDQEITVYRSFPTAFRHFVGTLTGKEDFPKLRLISLIGEPLYRKDVELFKRHFPPSCLLINNLGSTETGTFRQYVIDRNSEIAGSIVPVGYGTEDVGVLLLDDVGREVGVNCVGEIAVKSRYLSLGYWRKPDLTESRFRSDPKEPDKRIYFTGDLGRMSEDGCLDCLGRKDFQVKVRSMRVDPREVEAVLRDHSGVKETTVIAQEQPSGDMRLVTYFVPQTHPAPTVSELRKFLKEKISDHMIPSTFVKLDALPLTATGKVDRRALPDPGKGRPELETIYAPPQSDLEEKLAKIWGDVLSLDRVGVNDNFFDLGGNSLLAVQLITCMEEVFGKQLIPAKVFQSPTIAQLATILRQEKQPDSWSSLIPVQPSGSQPPFFWVHGDLSNSFLPRYLGWDQPLYGLEHQSQDGKPALYDSVESIASHYLDEIHTVQPKGPYFLGGYSFGAMVAFEMAQQLKKAGADVALLALLDPPSVTSSKSSSSVVPSSSNRLTNSAALFREEIRRHWRHLAQVGAPEKLAYVLIRVKWKVINKVQQLIWPINKILKKVVWKAYLAMSRPLPPSLRSRYILDIYHHARLKYVPQRYPGRAIYIKGEMRPSAHLLAWSRLVDQGLEVQVVPGNHADVIKEPYAHLWAEKLKTWLRAAQETHATKQRELPS